MNPGPSFEIENLFKWPVAGIDEVGYGAWAGPVVVAAVVLPLNCPASTLGLLNDSKKLSPSQRDHVYEQLISLPDILISIQEASAHEIDQSNVRVATLGAMSRAIELIPCVLTAVLVDGTARPACKYPCHTYVKGDQRSYSIAAASIIAKVTRDRLMQKLALDQPHFGWEKNVGYGTKKHSEALQTVGPTEWHRKSYKPIAQLLERSPA
ncbi:MAG: ribonuclease HII [Alphaproteobacteria bacterium]